MAQRELCGLIILGKIRFTVHGPAVGWNRRMYKGGFAGEEGFVLPVSNRL